MGLAGRKEKQRIGPDPRNLTWAQAFFNNPDLLYLSLADLFHIYPQSPLPLFATCLNLHTDNSRFGQQYLAKFGWTPDSGSGLGANGEGRLAHISVAQKLNLLGIGNGPTGGGNNPDAIAWKQSKDFEGVLKRLNGGEVEEVEIEQALLHGFVRGETTESTIENSPTHEEVLAGNAEKQRRKEEKRRQKQEQSKVETDKNALQALTSKQPNPEWPQVAVTPTKQSKPSRMGPRMAHRAKFRASKQLASLSSTALSEILGVSPSGSATPISITQSDSVPVMEQPTHDGNATLRARDDQLTTSTTSVADYFAAKMKARRLGTQTVSESQSPLESDSPVDHQEDDKPRRRRREKGKDKKRKREVEDTGGGENDMDVDETPDAIRESDGSQKSQEETRKEKKKKRRKQVLDA